MNTRRRHNRIKTRAMKLYTLKAWSFVLLVSVVVTVIAVYVTLIGLSVKSVVERKEAETRLASLRADVAEMESEYIKRVGDITIARAGGIGLGTVASKSYAERKVLVGKAY
jgi:hypothetical protein